MNRPLVAIIGRPNVGKSTLFNRLTGSRKSIVGDEPGITRDRIYGDVEWKAKTFELVDTGGIVPDDEAVIPANIFKQAGFAIDKSQAIIWVVDAGQALRRSTRRSRFTCEISGNPFSSRQTRQNRERSKKKRRNFFRFGFGVTPSVRGTRKFDRRSPGQRFRFARI